MKLPVEWIKEYAPVEGTTEEIAERLTMAGLEVEETAESEFGDVLDIKVTPNRGDCLSVIGVARELCAAHGVRITSIPRPSTDSGSESVHVSIELPDDCPRYSARVIRNARSAPSPNWMQIRLTAAGMRPIGGIVDITNYVMLEMGQPLHAFDLDKLRGAAIAVRRARPGEALTTLDGIERKLTADMLMICDAERVVALAGVMGGAETEIGGSTRNVLLESAHFNPLRVRPTSKALDLKTEASYRFERHVDPEGVVAASERACQLIHELGMGEPESGGVDSYPLPFAPRSVRLRLERVSRLLGFPVTEEQITDTLNALGFQLEVVESVIFSAAVPSWRPDIVREEDLIEEVGRVVGYEHIPENLPSGSSTQGGDSDYGRFVETLREVLVGAGLQEVISHTLIAPRLLEGPIGAESRVAIRSALSADLSGLRRSLIPGLVDALDLNARRGQTSLALFEIGKVFQNLGGSVDESTSLSFALTGPLAPGGWKARPENSDYFTARGILELISTRLRLPDVVFERTDDPRFHPERAARVMRGNDSIGIIGELHPNATADLHVRQRVIVGEIGVSPLMDLAGAPREFVTPSPFPSITRDLAPRVRSSVPYSQVQQAVESVSLLMLEKLTLTDVFSGPPLEEGIKSLTLSLVFRSSERTLTDEEINAALGQIRKSLEDSCGAVFAA